MFDRVLNTPLANFSDKRKRLVLFYQYKENNKAKKKIKIKIKKKDKRKNRCKKINDFHKFHKVPQSRTMSSRKFAFV